MLTQRKQNERESSKLTQRDNGGRKTHFAKSLSLCHFHKKKTLTVSAHACLHQSASHSGTSDFGSSRCCASPWRACAPEFRAQPQRTRRFTWQSHTATKRPLDLTSSGALKVKVRFNAILAQIAFARKSACDNSGRDGWLSVPRGGRLESLLSVRRDDLRPVEGCSVSADARDVWSAASRHSRQSGWL
jgi:hypothetical protein